MIARMAPPASKTAAGSAGTVETRFLDLPGPLALDRLLGAPDARFVDWRDPTLVRALQLAESLAGAPRHLSVHSGGLVIADRELTQYLPLERAAKGVVVSQFEMRAVEAIGLVKMDLLGNRALTTIGECVSLLPADAALDPDTIPEHDGEFLDRVANRIVRRVP